jgi:hypothetical protein
MKHLSSSELVGLVEGTLADHRAAHVEGCGVCRAAAADLGAVMRRAASVDDGVPEPSPLFWDHLSARVREAVAHEQVGRAPWWLASWLAGRPFAPVAAALVILVLVSATVVMRRPALPIRVDAPRDAALVESGMDVDATLDPANSEVWEVLTAAAADLELDDAHAAGMSVQSSAIDGAVQRLSTDELNELGRLLQTELKRSSN